MKKLTIKLEDGVYENWERIAKLTHDSLEEFLPVLLMDMLVKANIHAEVMQSFIKEHPEIFFKGEKNNYGE